MKKKTNKINQWNDFFFLREESFKELHVWIIISLILVLRSEPILFQKQIGVFIPMKKESIGPLPIAFLLQRVWDMNKCTK